MSLHLARHLVGGLASLFCLVAFFLPGAARACGCGEFGGMVVAHGSSLYEVPWRIKARRQPWSELFESASLEAQFSVGPPDSYTNGGYSKHIGLPIHRLFVFSAIRGSEFDDFPEGDLSGLASWRVSRMILKMNDGEKVVGYPSSAPVELRRRFPWLRGVRFFDIFFPDSQAPEVVTALSRDGRVLARSREGRFGFYGSLYRGRNARRHGGE